MRLLPPIYKKARPAGSLFLALWLGGFACLFACAGVLADSSDSCNLEEKPAPSETVQKCELTGKTQAAGLSSSCCKKSAQPKQIKKTAQVKKSCTDSSSKKSLVSKEEPKRLPVTTSQMPPTPCGMTCCDNPRNLAEPVRVSRPDIAVDKQISKRGTPWHISELAVPQFAQPIQPRDRGDTYLHCCVFLI